MKRFLTAFAMATLIYSLALNYAFYTGKVKWEDTSYLTAMQERD